MEVHKKLVKASARHQEIVSKIDELDYAGGELATVRERLKQIKLKLNSEKYQLEKLEKEEERLASKHEGARTSVRKRLAGALGCGVLEARYVQKEDDYERQFCEASEATLRTKTQIKTLETQIDKLQTEEKRLEAVVNEQSALEAELKKMYTDLFSGPTKGFEEEDELEERVKTLKKSEKQLREEFNTLNAAYDHIVDAQHDMLECARQLDAALQSSTMDLMGHDWADFAEHSQVASAAKHAKKAKLLIEQARELDSRVGPMHHVQIHESSFVTDYVFDNVFTDVQNHSNIQKALGDARRAEQELETIIIEVRKAVTEAGKKVDREHKRLCEARRALAAMRQSIIEDAGLFAHTEPAVSRADTASKSESSETSPAAPVATVEATMHAAPPYARSTDENANVAEYINRVII